MFFGTHTHSEFSNTRGFLDSTNKLKDLAVYSKSIGYSGFALTDHDCISGHLDAQNLIHDLRKQSPEEWDNFKIALGNEIYLTSRKEIEAKQYNFYHFILIAKDEIGHAQIRELSTRAWCDNGFVYVNMRTPTYFEDLFEVIGQNPGHVIGQTACLGGQLDHLILDAYHINTDKPDFTLCKKWITKLSNCFGEGNFFLELQSSAQVEQHIVNKYLIQLSEELNIPYVISCDAHYLTKEAKPIHEAFLKSNDKMNGERELGSFYDATYVQSETEIHEYLDASLGYEAVQKGLDNTQLIYNMCTEYDLSKPLDIPYVAFDTTEPSEALYLKYKDRVPLFEYFYNSKIDSDRHLCRDLLLKLEERPEEFDNPETYAAMHDCLEAIITSSEAQHTAWSGYLLLCKEIIKTIWESGSLCGPARGSGTGFLLLYMLDITQINPLREDTPTYFWRFLHSQRASVLDIDCDSEGSKKPIIIENLQKKYGGYRHVTKVQTILTAKSKNAIQIACRGLGYTNEDGVYLASFISAERGILHTLSQTFYGDEENGILPNAEFVNLMTNKYSDVWEVAQSIEGLCVGVGSHAGGVIISAKDMVNATALMTTRSGDIVTQYDLHKDEQVGLIKFDVLNIDALEKIHTELDLLLEDGLIEWQGDLKSTYEKYLGVYNLDRNNPAIWDMIDQHKILSLFQFEKSSGYQAIELGQPRSLAELTALNSVMRLMAQPGQSKSPLEIYAQHRQNINTWYKEMDDWGLTKSEQEILKKHALSSYGLLSNQEQFMAIVQEPELGGWDLIYGDKLRKAVAKKKPKEFLELQKQFFDRVEEKHLSKKLCNYVFELISQSRGYSFNSSHTLSYSIVGLQEANLAYRFPIVYWNAANLISDSGGEDSNVKYGKIAAAVGRMRKEGIAIIPPYINDVRFGFKPDAEKQRIVYGLKAVNGVGADLANTIVANQPYTSLQDFYTKMKANPEVQFGDMAMIQLIKAGAFDELESKPRYEIMRDFIKSIAKPVNKITANHVEDLAKLGMLTNEEQAKELRYIRFKKWVYKEENIDKKVGKTTSTFFYRLDHKFAEPYFNKEFAPEMEEGIDYQYNDDGTFLIVKRGRLDKLIDKKIQPFIDKITSDSKYLEALNNARFLQVWNDKVGSDNISRWEMDSMNYYYHDHELDGINRKTYGVVDFDTLPPEPEIAEMKVYGGREIPRYALKRVIGTVIDKDTNHNTVTLLTPDGVVTVRFYAGQFTFYAREIAQKDPITGTKTIIDKSWFKRGTRLLITGVRMGEQFIAKNYKDSIYKHSVQLIKDITEEGKLIMITDRASTGEEAEDAIGI